MARTPMKRMAKMTGEKDIAIIVGLNKNRHADEEVNNGIGGWKKRGEVDELVRLKDNSFRGKQ
jgi:hypothetical protein